MKTFTTLIYPILNRSEILPIVEKAVRMEEGKERYLHYENVPDMEDILYTRELKIMVKMTNHEYTSIHDIFEKSGPGRYMSDRDRLLLEKEQKKREALKMKLHMKYLSSAIRRRYSCKIYTLSHLLQFESAMYSCRRDSFTKSY